jgi:hypothetical protein
MKMKNYNDTIGNRTRNIPACSATACPLYIIVSNIYMVTSLTARNVDNFKFEVTVVCS